MYSAQSLGAMWLLAIGNVLLPPIGLIASAKALSRQHHFSGDSIAGLIYPISAYCVLLVLCLRLIINGARREKGSVVSLGFIILTLTLLILWVGYKLSKASWKPGG